MNNSITQSKVYRRCNHPTTKWVFFFVEVEYDIFFSGALARSGAPWVRKFGNLCIQEILVLRRKNNTCYEKQYKLFWISFAVVFGLLVLGTEYVRALSCQRKQNGTLNTIYGKLGIGHLCYSQSTAVKKGYPMTSVTWLHPGLRYTNHGGHVIFESYQFFVFDWSLAQVDFLKDEIQFAHCLR